MYTGNSFRSFKHLKTLQLSKNVDLNTVVNQLCLEYRYLSAGGAKAGVASSERLRLRNTPVNCILHKQRFRAFGNILSVKVCIFLFY